MARRDEAEANAQFCHMTDNPVNVVGAYYIIFKLPPCYTLAPKITIPLTFRQSSLP